MVLVAGTMEGAIPRDAPRKPWLDNIREWSDGLTWQECKMLVQSARSEQVELNVLARGGVTMG